MTSRHPRARTSRTLAAFATLATTAALTAGCGGSDANNVSGEPGKTLFTQKCGSCHVLADAETKGTSGPNLDDAFAASLAVGQKRSTVASVVEEQIKRPMGKVMPANLVKGEDARAVAEYVADSVGRSK